MGIVWSPAFQHQFLDANPRNFSAAPGTHNVLPQVLFVPPTPPRDQLGFPIRPGHRFEYAFDPAFANVIGVDIKLDIAFPPGAAASQLSGQVVLANGEIRLLLDFLSDIVRLQLLLSNDAMAISVPIQPGEPLRVHARWHTHGQGQIWVDGRLRRYDPNVAAGALFNVAHLRFGHHMAQAMPNASAFLIRRICVKLLRREDPGRVFESFFPIPEPSPLGAACLGKLAKVDDAIMAEIRAFMRQAIARLTSSWGEGSPGGPFTPEAVAAHDAALAAGRAFMAFMVHRRKEDAQQVKGKAAEFLTLIKATDPAGYAQLVGRIETMTGAYDHDCLARLEPLAQQYGTALQPIRALLEALLEVIRSPGGTS